MSHTVYVCVGLPGSGKSTHSRVVELTSHFAPNVVDQVVRINQDALGTRKECNDLMVRAIDSDRSVIVDRCNVSRSQRRYWIEVAKRKGYRVVVELFRVDAGTCLRRANLRTDHETMTNPASYRAIIAGFKAAWQEPSFDEGIDEIRVRNESGKIIETLLPQPARKPTMWQRFKRWLNL